MKARYTYDNLVASLEDTLKDLYLDPDEQNTIIEFFSALPETFRRLDLTSINLIEKLLATAVDLV